MVKQCFQCGGAGWVTSVSPSRAARDSVPNLCTEAEPRVVHRTKPNSTVPPKSRSRYWGEPRPWCALSWHLLTSSPADEACLC